MRCCDLGYSAYLVLIHANGTVGPQRGFVILRVNVDNATN